MILEKIVFSNYKKFEKEQELEIKPITIVIGENSTGKSSILRLPILITNSFLNTNSNKVIDLEHSELDLGYEYKDLLYNKYESRILKFDLEFRDKQDKIKLTFEILNIPEKGKQIISQYKLIAPKSKVDLIGELQGDYSVIYKGYVNELDIKDNKNIAFANLLPIYKSQADSKLGKLIDNIRDNYLQILTEQSRTIQYLLPFRVLPKRIYDNRRSSLKDYNGQTIPQTLFFNKKLLIEVAEWYINNFDIDDIKLEMLDKIRRNSRHFEINIYHKGVPINICDVGQGISQTLPIITRAFMDKANTIEVIEQPELHLHPAAHGKMANLIANSVLNNNNSKYIIETHSENFILRIRRLIAEGTIPKEFVNIYWIDDDLDNNITSLKKIMINDDGEVDYWPEGIFSEGLEEVKAIRKAQRNSR